MMIQQLFSISISSKPRITMKVVILFFLSFVAMGVIQREVTYGPNLVFNQDFLVPTLPSNTYMKAFPPSIMGWKCLNYCFLINLPVICWYYNRPCHINYKQGIDLNSQCIFENVTQTITIEEAGEHIFHFEWTSPIFAAAGKQFKVWLNDTVVIKITHNSTSIVPNALDFTFDFPKGNLTISMMMTAGANDCWGTVITNVSIYKVIRPIQDASFESFVSLMMNNNATTFMNQLPGSRIFLNFLANQYRLLDRMEFYYYHRQNFTFYSEIFLSNLSSMMRDKGSLFQIIIQSYQNENSFCSSVSSSYNSLSDALNQKYAYTDQVFLQKNSNGIGFFANNLDFFFFELPFIVILHFLLSIAFNILFNYRISLILRKYSLYGTLLFIIYQGNVEHFTFYFLAQCKNFFSSSPIHKLANVFMLMFFFLLIVFVIGGMLWFRFHYRKLTKYFVEDFEVSVFSIVLESFERSIFPLLFGSIHILLMDDLKLQTILLLILEISYLSVRIICIRSLQVQRRFKIWFSVSGSFLRLSFIATFYAYETDNHPVMINYIHLNTIVIYLINGFMEFLEEIFNSAKELKESLRKWCNKKKDEKKNKQKEESVINISLKLTKNESEVTQALKETIRTTEKPLTRTILKERSQNKKSSVKKVKIMTQRKEKNSGIYVVKNGKVYSLSNLKDPICNSEVQFQALRKASKHQTVKQASANKTILLRKVSKSCKQIQN